MFVSSDANSMPRAKARYGGWRDFRQETRHGAQGKSGRQRSRGLSDPAGRTRGRVSVCQLRHRLRPIDRGFRQGRADRRPGAETDPRHARKPGAVDGAWLGNGDRTGAGGHAACQRRHCQWRMRRVQRRARQRANIDHGRPLAIDRDGAAGDDAMSTSTGRRRCSTKPAWCASWSNGTTS